MNKAAVVLLMLFASTARAENAYEWVDAHTQYEGCSVEQAATIHAALREGFNGLLMMNRALVEDRLRLNEKRTVTFDCDPNRSFAEGIAANATIQNQANLLGLIKFKPRTLKRARIAIGPAIVGKTEPVGGLKVGILHEYLHFLRFDNLPTPDHNKFPRFKGIDVVYSCSLAAYVGSGPDLARTVERTCRAARAQGGAVELRTTDVEVLENSSMPSTSINCLVKKSKSVEPYQWSEWDYKACLEKQERP